jgi:hypothetical protein
MEPSLKTAIEAEVVVLQNLLVKGGGSSATMN